MTADTSSGYHSHDDDNKQATSSLELENRLLKNEVTSLNQEMASVIERAKNSQEGVWLFTEPCGFIDLSMWLYRKVCGCLHSCVVL